MRTIFLFSVSTFTLFCIAKFVINAHIFAPLNNSIITIIVTLPLVTYTIKYYQYVYPHVEVPICLQYIILHTGIMYCMSLCHSKVVRKYYSGFSLFVDI